MRGKCINSEGQGRLHSKFQHTTKNCASLLAMPKIPRPSSLPITCDLTPTRGEGACSRWAAEQPHSTIQVQM